MSDVPTDADSVSHRRAVSARAVTIGLVCATFFAALAPYNDFKIGATYLAGNQFPITAIFVLFVLAAVNPLLRAWRPALAFRPGEMLTVWTLILVASGIPSSGMMRYLLPNIVAPTYFSDSVNRWEEKIWGESPEWLRVTDKAAAHAFFVGYPKGQERIPWEAWATPLFAWGLFALFFLTATFCIANILRRQWVEYEKFAFPLVTLPVLLAEEPMPGQRVNALLRHPYLWIAVGLTTALHTLNGLHRLYPTFPEIRTRWNLLEFLITAPWNQIGTFNADLYPVVVGIAYLLPTEVAFSLWFFHLFYKAEILLGTVYNWDMPAPLGGAGQKQFHTLQVFGGGLAFLTWILWAARRHLRDVWQKAIGGPRAAFIDDRGEMFSYRATLIALAAAYLGMTGWLLAARVPLLLIGAFLLLLTISVIVISYLVTQAGTLYMAFSCGTLDYVGATRGTELFEPHAWYTTYRLEWSFCRDTRELLLSEVLNSARAADAGETSLRSLFRAMVAAIAVAFIVGGIAALALPYYHGGGNAMASTWTYRTVPQRPLQQLGGAAIAPIPPVLSNGLHIVAGYIGVLGILLLRAYKGLSLHPIGFLGASTTAGHNLWVSLLIGWLARTLIQRYGGMKGYGAWLPFFLGLILGDALNGVVWIIIGYLTDTGYNLMPV
jgi:hypothetical protein